jgi:hypothetical protein
VTGGYPNEKVFRGLKISDMLGRRNWMHIGSPLAGPKVAAIFSGVESCRRLPVPVRDYFSEILPGLADLPIRVPPRPHSRCVGRPASMIQATGVQCEG